MLCSVYGVSKPGREFDSKVPSVLLNGVFRVFGAPGVGIFLVKQVVDTGRQIEMSAEVGS